MRTLEIILMLSVTLLPFIKRRVAFKIPSNYLLISLGIVLFLHLIIDGWRWQMVPAYVLALVITWRIRKMDLSQTTKLSFIRVLGFIGIILLAIVGWILPGALPVFTLPQPQGEYNVGTFSLHVVSNRDEVITEDPNDQRELMYKIWYPSDEEVTDHQRDSYLDPAGRKGFATKYGLPARALNYLEYVKTHVYKGLPVAKGQFPVLIVSHGYGSNATGYYSLLTEIASQGYIIINMNHTYESLGATFPDGREAYFNFQYQQEISKDSWSQIEPMINLFKQDISYEERHPQVKELIMSYYETATMDRWADDIIETIDRLETWNKTGTMNESMDLSKIGVFGHSNGGGSGGLVPLRDTRVKAAANLDGISWGNVIDTTYQIPFLYVSADWPAEKEDFNQHIYKNKSSDYFYEGKLLQSGHPNFMDIPFMIPISAVAGTGNIDPFIGAEITNKLLLSFFDRHLKQDFNADPSQIEQQYELLELTVFEGDSVQ